MKTLLIKAPTFVALMALLVHLFTTAAFAQTTKATVKPTPKPTPTPVVEMVTREEVVCDPGTYGTQNCRTVTRQFPKHPVIDTAAPDITLIGLALFALAGASLFVITFKK